MPHADPAKNGRARDALWDPVEPTRKRPATALLSVSCPGVSEESLDISVDLLRVASLAEIPSAGKYAECAGQWKAKLLDLDPRPSGVEHCLPRT